MLLLQVLFPQPIVYCISTMGLVNAFFMMCSSSRQELVGPLLSFLPPSVIHLLEVLITLIMMINPDCWIIKIIDLWATVIKIVDSDKGGPSTNLDSNLQFSW